MERITMTDDKLSFDFFEIGGAEHITKIVVELFEVRSRIFCIIKNFRTAQLQYITPRS